MLRRPQQTAAELTPDVFIRVRVTEAARTFAQQVLHILGSATLGELKSMQQGKRTAAPVAANGAGEFSTAEPAALPPAKGKTGKKRGKYKKRIKK